MTQGVLVLAPHPDDETLGCGLMLARHPDKSQLHIAFITDGSGQGAGRDELAARREGEARLAGGVYGLKSGQLHFLRMPDGQLHKHRIELTERLRQLIGRLRPGRLYVPFRYDRHPDHIAVNRAACDLHDAGEFKGGLLEYFVYTHSRLLPGGDIRHLVNPRLINRIDAVDEAVELRRRALVCHASQMGGHDEPVRPVLPRGQLEQWSSGHEYHLVYDARLRGRSVLVRARAWVPVLARLEPAARRLVRHFQS